MTRQPMEYDNIEVTTTRLTTAKAIVELLEEHKIHSWTSPDNEEVGWICDKCSQLFKWRMNEYDRRHEAEKRLIAHEC